MKQRLSAFTLAAFLALGFAAPTNATSASPEGVRAAFVRLLAGKTLMKQDPQPEDLGASQQNPIRLCVVGDSKEIEEESYKDTVREVPFIRAVPVTDHSKEFLTANCHVLYIAASENDKVESLVEAVKGYPILTMSTAKRFVRRGGMIGLVPYQDNIRFTINRYAIVDAKLRANPDYFALAVEDPG